MIDEKKERFPGYIPAYYRFFAKVRKIYRQAIVRIAERHAKKYGAKGVTPDGEQSWDKDKNRNNPTHSINKSAVWIEEDLRLPEIYKLVRRFEDLKKDLNSRGLRYTNTAGTFLSRMFYPRSERTKMWENTWAINHSRVQKGHRVLDVGGPLLFFASILGK